jgi:uncharacterized protein (DUF983 family)
MERQGKSFIYSILNAKCPRCREGSMFPGGTLYTRKFADMHPACSCCGQTFEPEPGFYYGAMYVSFGFSTAIFLMVFITLQFFVTEISTIMMGVAVLVVMLGLLPVSFRLSRALWIYIFIRYEGPCHLIPKK